MHPYLDVILFQTIYIYVTLRFVNDGFYGKPAIFHLVTLNLNQVKLMIYKTAANAQLIP